MATEHSKAWQDEKAAKLLEAMLQGTMSEIKPQLSPESELGFSFPSMRQLLNTTDKESATILESLADENILVKKFFDKFLHCPQCHSMNLRPVYHCPKCGSGNIARGRVLEHPVCKYVDTDDVFLLRGKLVCPKCKQELGTLGTDYRSLGVLYKCHDCEEISNYPAIKWRCLKCSSTTLADKIVEVNAYSYSLNEDKRNWLGFELKPKSQLLRLLRDRQYEIRENAKVKGKSGAQHAFDMLASRDDGVLIQQIAIDIEIAANEVGLDKVFDFDDKAYDGGIQHKVLIAIPGVTEEARRFAARQRMHILNPADLEAFLARSSPPALAQEIGVEKEMAPFQFQSKPGLIDYLQSHGYEVQQNAAVKGRSEAEHTFDLLATRDDGIVVHNIAIGIEAADNPIDIDKVFDFDDKAYDSDIPDKILIAVPGLTREANRFAQRQRIRVFEAPAVEPEE
jgi:transposase-like protein